MADFCSQKVRPARCLSPIPKGPVTRSKANAMKWPRIPRLHPRTASRRLKKKIAKTLTSIDENCELNISHVSELTQKSSQFCMSKNTDKADESTLHQSCREESFNKKESSNVSSEGMTLPTGVSSFLLDCLDSVPISETIEHVDSSLNSCLSPEEFRGAEECSAESCLKRTITRAEDCLMYKNSTLLDTSKALNIDLISQITDLSAILEPSSEDNVKKSRREQLKDEHSVTAQQVSTVVAGKKVCKLASVRETTPTQTKGACPVLERPLKKEVLKSKYIKCKKKVDFFSPLDIEVPSCDLGQNQTEMSNNSKAATTEDVPFRISEPHEHYSSLRIPEKNRQVLTSTPFLCRENLVMDLSPICASPLEEELIINTTGPFVCSSEIVPANVSTDEFTRYQVLFKTLEICYVIRASESQVQHYSAERFPVDENVLISMKKLPIDYIIKCEEK